ncbi:MAG: DUF1499 domain-containing protein [Pseudomonadota bacterium]
MDFIDGRSWWSSALLIAALASVIIPPLGALGTRFGLWGVIAGFKWISLGVILAALAVVLGCIAAVYAHKTGLGTDRNIALISIVIGIVVCGIVATPALKSRGLPRIHNISTDTQAPPQFVSLVAEREAANANPHTYDPNVLAAPQRTAYPDVQPFISNLSIDKAVDRVSEILRQQGIEIVNLDRDQGLIEATDTTFWFGFKDGVVVRVREHEQGSIVDIRSVSRVGKSDLGKNAKRIEAILSALKN